jgi:sterol desaturase/sphingolipid hydroxylase (fatty acid hydroxylase superfamily)
MTNDLHNRAKEFIARRHVEGLAANDEQWLNAHLAGCEFCSSEQRQLRESLSALRTMHWDVPRNLASRTQFRVRMRAEELRERGPVNRLIWAVAAMSWIFGLATAPLVWRSFAWLGSELHLPKLVWITGVALWWAVPALVATGIILFGHKGPAGASE